MAPREPFRFLPLSEKDFFVDTAEKGTSPPTLPPAPPKAPLAPSWVFLSTFPPSNSEAKRHSDLSSSDRIISVLISSERRRSELSSSDLSRSDEPRMSEEVFRMSPEPKRPRVEAVEAAFTVADGGTELKSKEACDRRGLLSAPPAALEGDLAAAAAADGKTPFAAR